jgi:Tfp pilus assembly protein PilO
MKKNRSILIIFLLVLTVFLFETYFFQPKSEMMRESIAVQYDKLRKYESFIKGSAITEDEIKSAVKDMEKMEKRLINEKSEFLAVVKLQGEVSDLAGKAGLNIMNIRPMNTGKAGKYLLIPVYFEGNCNIKQMSDFLKSIETDGLLIKIDKLNLNITNMQNPRELKFKIQVSGLAKT